MFPALSELVSWLRDEHASELADNIVNWLVGNPEYKVLFEGYAQFFEPHYAIYLITETIRQYIRFMNLGYY